MLLLLFLFCSELVIGEPIDRTTGRQAAAWKSGSGKACKNDEGRSVRAVVGGMEEKENSYSHWCPFGWMDDGAERCVWLLSSLSATATALVNSSVCFEEGRETKESQRHSAQNQSINQVETEARFNKDFSDGEK